MIDNKLRELIQAKVKLGQASFYRKLKQIREDLSYSIPNEIAVYVLASENGIDPLPFIQDHEKEDYRQAIQMRRKSTEPPKLTVLKTGKKETVLTTKKIVIHIPNMPEYEVPNLHRSIIEDAARMSESYPVIYLFENSVREFIKEVLDKKKPDWWDKVNSGIKKRVEDRKSTETQNAYHGRTRVHPIQYVDFDDLRNIIQNNAKIFNDYMPDNNVEYIQQKLREIKDSRNILMHCNPLTENDTKRVNVYFIDWQNQLISIKEKLEHI